MAIIDEAKKLALKLRTTAGGALRADLNKYAPGNQSIAGAFNYVKQNPAQFAVLTPQSVNTAYQRAQSLQQSQVPLAQRVGNIGANTFQTYNRGVSDLGRAATQVRQPGVFPKFQAASSALSGAGRLLSSGSIPFQAANYITSGQDKNSVLQRTAAGFQRGMTGLNLAPNIQRRQVVKTPLGNFDPAETVGSMVGFVNNPINSKIFKATEAIFPTISPFTKAWLARTTARGAIEDVMLQLGDMPDNLTPLQKAQYIANVAKNGAISELVGQSIFAGAGKVKDTKAAAKLFDELSEVKRKWTIPVETMKLDRNGERITVPMWQYKMNIGLSTKDINELSPEDYAKVKKPAQSTLGDIKPKFDGVIQRWGTRNQYYLNNPFRNKLDEMVKTKKFDLDVIKKADKWEMEQVLKDKPAFLNDNLPKEEVIKFAKKHGLWFRTDSTGGLVVAKDIDSLNRVLNAIDSGNQRELGLALGYEDIWAKNANGLNITKKGVVSDSVVPGTHQRVKFLPNTGAGNGVNGESVGVLNGSIEDSLNGSHTLKIPLSNEKSIRQSVAQAPKSELTTRQILKPEDQVLPGKLSPQADLATTPTQTKPQIPEPQKPMGVDQATTQQNPQPDASNPSIPQLTEGNPVQRIIDALTGAKPLRGQQEALYSAERSKRVARVAAMGSKVKGEKGFYAQLGQLKGELPKVQFESIRKQVSQSDVDSLFNTVESSNLTVFEKITAKQGLSKLLGEQGGMVPTKGELTLLNEIFPKEFMDAVMAKRPLMQKLVAGVESVINIPRSLMATADLSAPLRQGVFLVGRPKQWAPAFKDMFKYAFSEKAYQGLLDDIKSRPSYTKMREARLAITDMNTLDSREEAFMSNLIEKVPGFGEVAKGSNRAYSGFLNKLRADVFDDLLSKAEKSGEVSPEVLKNLGSFVNAATGRGNLPQVLERAAPILNATFFSPRLMASRLNLLNPVYYAQLDPFTRKEALKSLLGFGMTATSILALAKLGGAEVEDDPRSADFAKIKVGNTRYDILGGFQQYIRTAAQLITGQKINTVTGKISTVGEGYKPLSRAQILGQFFESKESPVASFIISLLQGEDVTGQPFNVSSELASRLIPLLIQGIYDIAKDQDSIGKGIAMSIPSIFGVGTQAYGKQELVTGKNQIGQTTSQIRQVQGLPETISEKLFGKQPLGSSSSTSVRVYYDQLSKLPREQAAQAFREIAKTNPELAKKISKEAKERKQGITIENKVLKEKGVTSGDRAIAIAKEFKRLKSKEEKAALWSEYVKKKIITKDVAKQLQELAMKGSL